MTKSFYRTAVAAVSLLLMALLSGCAGSRPAADARATVRLPLLRGWVDGHEVFYVTTDVSDAEIARAKGANHVPRLADAVPAGAGPTPGRRSAVDKVYAVTNFDQGSVFASGPAPIGHLNLDGAYSPLWQMVRVSWRQGQVARLLRSQEEVLDAAEKGAVVLQETSVVLNCPIVHLGAQGGLPGATIEAAGR